MAAALWHLSGTRLFRDTVTRVVPGASAYFYEAGTTTPLDVFQDYSLTVPHDDPVLADAYGVWPAVYIRPGAYRVRILDDEAEVVADFDGVVAPGVPGSDTLFVSPFSETLLDDADATSWLTTLGFNAWVIGNLIAASSAAAARAALDVQQNGISTVVEKTANHTLELSDVGKTIHMNVASGNTLTVPTNASVAFPVGAWINIVQTGAGTTTIDAASGVTLNGVNGGDSVVTAQWGGVTLQKTATNTWVMVGLHSIVS